MKKIDFNSKRMLFDVAAIFAAVLLSFLASAQPDIYLKTVISSNLTAPIHMAHAGDGSGRIFVAERAGVIKVFSSTYTYLGIYLNMSSRISLDQEGALLSIAFHPNFETNGSLFVYFSDNNDNVVISRYDSSIPAANSMDDVTPVDVLTISHPANNHYGGEMHFSANGDLYASIGDGGGSNDGSNNAQTLGSLLGKILRITPATSGVGTYTIPADNPFPTNTGLPRTEVFAFGLRNPFRWSFDRSTGDVWIGDVGQNNREEIDFVASANFKGTNFAWRCYEGSIRNPAYPDPTYQVECGSYSNFTPHYDYSRGATNVSVMGGVVYRGTKYPLMDGYYIGADYYTGTFHVFAPLENTLSTMTGLPAKAGITDFGESEGGDIFAVSMDENTIYRFADASVEPLPVTLVDFKGRPTDEGVQLTWKSSLENNFRNFDVEHSVDANNFVKLGSVAGSNRTAGSNYQYFHNGASAGNHYYRLKMVDTDETFAYSRIVSVLTEGATKGFVFPSVITGGTMTVNLTQNSGTLEIINTAGHVLLTSDVIGKTGKLDVSVSHLTAGLYIARLRSEGMASMQQKVMIIP